MASAFAHALVGLTAGKLTPAKAWPKGLLLLGILCTVLPDADVATFYMGIPYAHPFGHRGFAHSILFAVLLAAFVKAAFYRGHSWGSKSAWLILGFIFFCTMSHGILDAMTNGGRGVAFFFPWNERIFLPWRPLVVSPIGASKFFSEWGMKVIASEFRYVGIPCLLLLAGAFGFRMLRPQPS